MSTTEEFERLKEIIRNGGKLQMKEYCYREHKHIPTFEGAHHVQLAVNRLLEDLFRTMKRMERVAVGESMRFIFNEDEVELQCTLSGKNVNIYDPETIYRNGRTTVVKWKDGTITKVKLSEDEPDNPYNAFTAALAKKALGCNTRIRKIVEQKTVVQKK